MAFLIVFCLAGGGDFDFSNLLSSIVGGRTLITLATAISIVLNQQQQQKSNNKNIHQGRPFVDCGSHSQPAGTSVCLAPLLKSKAKRVFCMVETGWVRVSG
jgi:hypothetical protein